MTIILISHFSNIWNKHELSEVNCENVIYDYVKNLWLFFFPLKQFVFAFVLNCTFFTYYYIFVNKCYWLDLTWLVTKCWRASDLVTHTLSIIFNSNVDYIQIIMKSSLFSIFYCTIHSSYHHYKLSCSHYVHFHHVHAHHMPHFCHSTCHGNLRHDNLCWNNTSQQYILKY